MKNCNQVLIFKAASEEIDAEHSKDPYQDQLERLNATVRIIHVLDFRYMNLDVLKSKLDNPNNYSALVFGSPRCVRAVTKACEKLDSQWHHLPVFSVGETTARLAKNCLDLNSEGSHSGHGEALAPIILTYDLKKPVLMPCGNLSRDTISRLLKENGLSIDTVQVYETIPHPELESNMKKVIKDQNLDVIIYFSPSGVVATVPILQELTVQLDKIKWVSIGPTTEKALCEYGFQVSATASKPTPEGLAAAVSSIL